MAQLGVAELNALAESDLLDDSQKLFIDAALESMIQDAAEEIDEIEAAGDEANVIEKGRDDLPLPDHTTDDVRLTEDTGGAEETPDGK